MQLSEHTDIFSRIKEKPKTLRLGSIAAVLKNYINRAGAQGETTHLSNYSNV